MRDRLVLTPRQTEVAALLCRGRTHKQIAGELHVSDRTVDHHVTLLRLRTHSETTVQAIATLVRQGVV